jgi:SpoIID/LytB domain protein
VEVRDLETVLWNLSKEFGIDSMLVREWLETGCRLDIDITLRKQSGRIEEVNFKLEDQEFVVSGIRIRRILADRTGKLLPSNFFFMNESTGNWEKFYIIGAGAGHGKGMCQWGAIGLALKGNSYRNILGFYYPNLKMVKFY